MIDSEIKHRMLVNLRQQTLEDGIYMDNTPAGMDKFDLTGEFSRTYHFGKTNVHIPSPRWLYLRKGSTTHRVVDAQGRVFIVPAVGHNECYVTVTPQNTNDPVQF